VPLSAAFLLWHEDFLVAAFPPVELRDDLGKEFQTKRCWKSGSTGLASARLSHRENNDTHRIGVCQADIVVRGQK
jgi:hypothetical protein